MTVFFVLSIARCVALHQFYHAPISIFSEIGNDSLPLGFHSHPEYLNREVNVCAAKEWYRFPSHFLLPHGMKFRFVESRFKGLLPTYFDQGNVTLSLSGKSIEEFVYSISNADRQYHTSPLKINDLNQHEADRYVMRVFS
jgi:alpha-1,2-mannosyltransferase